MDLKKFVRIFRYNQQIKVMYHLNCPYYKKKFETIYELLDDIVLSGMDPNYTVYKDGKSVGTKAIDLIQF